VLFRSALPFYSSLRMEFVQTGNVKEKAEHEFSGDDAQVSTQTKTKVTVLKNKVGDPFRTAELRVRFGKGFSQEHAVLSYLVAHGVVKATSGVYKYPAELLPPVSVDKGESNQLAALEAHPDWLQALKTRAEEVLSQKGLEKIDGSKYDKFGSEIDGNVTDLSLAESQEFEEGNVDEDVSALLELDKVNKVDMSTGEYM